MYSTKSSRLMRIGRVVFVLLAWSIASLAPSTRLLADTGVQVISTVHAAPLLQTGDADLSITQSDFPDPVVAGDPLTYTLTIVNDGPGEALGVALADILPAQVRYESVVSSLGSCLESGGAVTCYVGALANGQSATIALVAAVDSSTTAPVSNVASLSSDTIDPITSNNAVTETTGVIMEADLSVEMVALPSPVEAGDTFTYSLTVSNDGSSDATGVTVHTMHPSQTSFVSVTPSQCTHDELSVTCDVGDLAADDEFVIQITVRASCSTSGFLSRLVTVTGNEPDPRASNNSTVETTSVSSQTHLAYASNQSGQMQLHKVRVNPIGGSQQLTYLGSGSQESRGPDWSAAVERIAFQFGATSVRGIHQVRTDGSNDTRLTFHSSDERDPSWSPDGRFIAYSWLNGSYYDLCILDTNGTPDDTSDDIERLACFGISSGTQETRPAWSPDGQHIAFGTTANGGDNEIWVVEVNPTTGIPNVGTAHGLTNNTFVDFDPAWSPDSSQIVYSSSRTGNRDIFRMDAVAGEFDPNNHPLVQLTTNPANDLNPSWSSDGRCIAFASERDGNRELYVMSAEDGAGQTIVAPNSAQDDDPVWQPVPLADLSIAMADSPDPVSVDRPLTYTLTVENHGLAPATNVIVTDTLPVDVIFSSAVASQGSCNASSGLVICQIGSLANGVTTQVILAVTVDPSASGPLNNAARVASSEIDPNTTNNHAVEQTGTRVSISGRITSFEGTPASGIVVHDDRGNSVTTNANGDFVFSNLEAGSYTITPASDDFNFVPISLTVNLDSQVNGLSYKAIQLPLIFIPGAAGSHLDQILPDGNLHRLWPASRLVDHEVLRLDLLPPLNIIPTDAIRQVIGLSSFHGPLLEDLVYRGGYREYEVLPNPLAQYRRTTNGCDLSQKDNAPTLFVFPYDWRRDSASSAQLLGLYVGCIHRLYPNSKINILAHSMGGLVARRYVLDNSNHLVDKLITIGSPFVGAPKAIYVLETGDWSPMTPWILSKSTLQVIAPTFPGLHQLVPSPSYFEPLGQEPFVEVEWDVNGDNQPLPEVYTYTLLTAMLDNRYFPYAPGANNAQFHNSAQDDWQNDQTGIEYYHIVGRQTLSATIGTVVTKNVLECNPVFIPVPPAVFLACAVVPGFEAKMTEGDGTVPLPSATRCKNEPTFGSLERCGTGTDLNAPTAVVRRFFEDSGSVDHVGLMSNREVRNYVLEILRPLEPPRSAAIFRDAQEPEQAQQNGVTTSTSGYFLKVRGAPSLIVVDDFGNSTQPINEVYGLAVPDVVYHRLGDESHLVIMPTDQAYSVTLSSGITPMSIDITVGHGFTPTQAIRYHDVALPEGTLSILRFSPTGIENLHYDGDGNGTFETPIAPTASVSGTAATDLDPPTIAISETVISATTLVTITATDTGSGVQFLWYSLDGASFRPYTSTLQVNTSQTPILYAFAQDYAANRSGLFQRPLATPTAVTLANFAAEPDAGGILVTWETISEIDNQGFNLYRATDPATPQDLLAFVPSQAPGSSQGFAYEWLDSDVVSGQTYYYWLEDIDLAGVATLHDPVSATFQTPTAVVVTDVRTAVGSRPVRWWLVLIGLVLALGAGLVTRPSID